MRYLALFLMTLFSFSTVLFALEEPLKDALLEKQAKEIFKSLKCEVCEGQSVLDSESDFAKSARNLVRDMLEKGFNQEQIYDALKSNYGESIMFKPPFNSSTILLWILPFMLIFIGAIAVIINLKKSKNYQ
jgi:cytochrome c-type biogenesis protein CcmH